MSSLQLTYPRAFSRGMSLIEVMVGMAIALVATLVIFQVFSSSNSNNRSTSAGNEAQISGNIGMFQMERDIKVAGMGFGTLTNMSTAGVPCNVNAINPALVVPAFTFPLVPVVITANGAAPDQINLLYGSSAYLTVGRTYSSGSITSKTTSGSRGGIQMGDLAIVVNNVLPPTACELVEITDNTNADGLTVDHLPGIGYTSFYGAVVPAASNHNSAGTPATLNNTGVLYDLGPQPVLNQWQVVNNSLVVSNLLGSAGGATPVAEGVVQLKAQYGIDDGAGGAVATDGIISPSEWRTAGPGVPADWSKVLAVRFALLARSSALERAAVTPVAPAWSGGNFDMTGQPANWQNYRYRVFESVVAMRNMLWPKCYPVACS